MRHICGELGDYSPFLAYLSFLWTFGGDCANYFFMWELDTLFVIGGPNNVGQRWGTYVRNWELIKGESLSLLPLGFLEWLGELSLAKRGYSIDPCIGGSKKNPTSTGVLWFGYHHGIFVELYEIIDLFVIRNVEIWTSKVHIRKWPFGPNHAMVRPPHIYQKYISAELSHLKPPWTCPIRRPHIIESWKVHIRQFNIHEVSWIRQNHILWT